MSEYLPPVSLPAPDRRAERFTALSLVCFLGTFALGALVGVIALIIRRPGGAAFIVGVVGGLALFAAFLGLIVYFLSNPLPEVPARTSSSAQSVPASGYGSEEYNSTAILAFVLVFFTVIPGIVLGHIAIGQTRRRGQRGHGLALAAVIIGYASVVLAVGFFLVVLVALRGN